MNDLMHRVSTQYCQHFLKQQLRLIQSIDSKRINKFENRFFLFSVVETHIVMYLHKTIKWFVR